MENIFFLSFMVTAVGTALTLVFVIGFIMIGGHKVLESYLNSIKRVSFLRITSVLFLVSWGIFSFPLVDFLMGLDFVTEFNSQTGGLDILGIEMSSQSFDYYFVGVLFSIIVPRAYYKLWDISSLLKEGQIKILKKGFLFFIERA